MVAADSGDPQDSRSDKLGLALSGGGFRASFFHIGLLARLAELDLLRKIEVLSTVSGGTVIGAMYYLKVRKLLQGAPDKDIDAEDYIQLVKELEKEFFDGVEHNLRTRTFADPLKNWKMYSRNYSRSDRIAELYTRYFYAPYVEGSLRPDVELRRTKIQPAGEEENFHPHRKREDGRTPNDPRANKVPILLINATTLNTGHNFRFTSTWMGEVPPRGPRGQITLTTRLRRAYFDDTDNLPDKYVRMPLGVAVASSTAVPGLFYPLALTDLYPGWTPQLVDGGVHDNQGVEGLLDENCTHLIISDASGQMEDVPELSTRALPVLMRTNSIMMDRVRQEEFETAVLQKEVGGIRDLVFFHLKQGLKQPELMWSGGEDESEESQEGRELLGHRVDRQVQILVSKIRTDLDSFTEVEAKAIMADGYLIATSQVDQKFGREREKESGTQRRLKAQNWGFLGIIPYLGNPGKDPLFVKQLEIASQAALKVFRRQLGLKIAGIAAVLAGVLGGLYYMIFVKQAEPIEWVAGLFSYVNTYRALGITIIVIIGYSSLFLVSRKFARFAQFRALPRNLVLKAGAASLICAAVWIHIKIFDRLFLKQGRVARLRDYRPASPPTPEGGPAPRPSADAPSGQSGSPAG